MAAPNLKAPVSVTGKSKPYAVTDTLAEVLGNASSSGKLLRVSAIRAANVDGTKTVKISVSIYRSSTHSYIIKNAEVPLGKALIISDRNEPINLEEGDAIYAVALQSNQVDLTVNYDEFT